jgi:hypothetical protein
MEETVLVRLKAHDPRRGHVLRRYTYGGIKIEGSRGWYRVEKDVAEYLKTVRQVDTDPHSPLAFDVATEDEARRIDAEEAAQVRPARATDNIPLSVPRAPAAGAITTADLADGAVIGGGGAADAQGPRRGRKGQE